eukprot:scaffold3207_cov112-Isochrysis_galbana.AAC.6
MHRHSRGAARPQRNNKCARRGGRCATASCRGGGRWGNTGFDRCTASEPPRPLQLLTPSPCSTNRACRAKGAAGGGAAEGGATGGPLRDDVNVWREELAHRVDRDAPRRLDDQVRPLGLEPPRHLHQICRAIIIQHQHVSPGLGGLGGVLLGGALDLDLGGEAGGGARLGDRAGDGAG